MSKVVIILLIITVLTGGTFGVLYLTGVIGGGDDTTDVCQGSHDWALDSRTDPKCYKEGSQVKVCTVCGTKETDVIPMSKHRITMIPEKAPTCTESGNPAGEMCINNGCGYISYYEEFSEKFDCPGHDFISTPGKAPTCTEVGYLDDGKHCSRCFIVDDQNPPTPIEMIDHEFVEMEGKAATCAEAGYSGDGTHCLLCGKIGVQPSEIYDKIEGEHTGEFKVTSRATCSSAGLMECSVCKVKVEFEPINPEAHNFTIVYQPEQPADCVTKTNGTKAIMKCSNSGCNTPTTGGVLNWEDLHSDDALEWVEELPATTESAGIKSATCEKCGETFKKDIPRITTGDFNEDNDIYPDDYIGKKRRNSAA